MSGDATKAPQEADPTTDSFLGGRVTLIQPRKGHRAGLDAALLQAVVPADATGLLVDLGAGVGTVAFSATARAPGLQAVTVEREEELAEMGRKALALPQNIGFTCRVRAVVGDVSDGPALKESLEGNAADWVLMNPPFDIPGQVRASPDEARRKAHVGDADLLESWCRTAATLLRPGGTLGIIHRAEALTAVLDALARRFGAVRIMPVHPADNAPAGRIVVTARAASRAPLTLLHGLVLHRADGSWTSDADAILKGEATLPL